MKLRVTIGNKLLETDLKKGIDISIPLQSGNQNPNAFGIQAPSFEPFKAGGFVGSVALGGSVNCENLFLNPHGNGTHTECVGHISSEKITIHSSLTTFFFIARLVTVTPENNVVNMTQINPDWSNNMEAIIFRTLPNTEDKKHKNWSGNNPSYFAPEVCSYLRERGIKHLLTDLPSVDPEHDEGKLSAHHAWWDYPANPRLHSTITEMIYVPENIVDGLYLLNLQIASIQSDASPSKPVLFPLSEV